MVVRAQSEKRVKRFGTAERVASSTCEESGLSSAGVTPSRSAGQSGAVALSGIGVGDGSFDRPVQHANGAVAPNGLVRSCHHGARLICNVRPPTSAFGEVPNYDAS